MVLGINPGLDALQVCFVAVFEIVYSDENATQPQANDVMESRMEVRE